MRILVFSAYYEPELVSSLKLSMELYEYLANNGNYIEIITPTPTRGLTKEEHSKFKKKKIEYKCDGKLKINRIPLFNEGKGIVVRAFRYILMNILFILSSFSKNCDVIFAQSTPPTMGAMAVIVKKIKKKPLIYNLQDIFPDSLLNTGITKKNSMIWKIGRKLENFTYKNCDKIIVISNSMKENILKKGVESNKIEVIYNWVDYTDLNYINKEDNYLYDFFKISKNEFNVVYAGNLGYAQDIENILNVAKDLALNKEINFLIFGKGNQEEKYKRIVEEKKIINVRFFPLLPQSETAYVYSLGDICLITCKKGFGDGAMPSKLWSIMACSRAIVASFDKNSDVDKIITENDIGICVCPENLEALKSSILEIKNKNLQCKFGKNSRRVLMKKYNKDILLQKYLILIKNVV